MTGRRAVFLDRDGVLTEPVYNPKSGEYESPHQLAELLMCEKVDVALRDLEASGYELFIVSNQPSFAKGKASLEEIQAIARETERRLGSAGVTIRESYYCYHHPDGVVPGYGGPCRCRKPSPYFLESAAERHGIDLARSWMVGDRDSDIECGQRAGCRTMLVKHPHAGRHQGSSRPDRVVADLAEAARFLAGTGPDPA